MLLDQTCPLYRDANTIMLMREFIRVSPGSFNVCEPTHARLVNSFTAVDQALGYLAGVNREERRRGVLGDSASQQRDSRLGAEQE